MASDGKYCCFICPKPDFSEKALSDTCPDCGRQFGFPLTQTPTEIGDFRVMKPLGRGFYGVTYVAERKGMLKTKRVLKVVPKAVYAFFKKSFADECTAHSQAAEGADFIVGIVDAFDSVVRFGDIEIDCHIAVLEFIDGVLLHSYANGEFKASAALTAQIAADLLRIGDELAARKTNHNDFHDGNIIVERLSQQRNRQGAMEPAYRVVAIDLGSLSEERRSGGQYKSDLHWIGAHIERLSGHLLNNSTPTSDLDARVALELTLLSKSLSAAVENQRRPTSAELIKRIENAFFRTAEPWRPWREALSLREFGDSYNAQTLGAWHVPQLLVDPDSEWQRAISSPGPLVVTGMRGCGKTMLLRALQFHARAVRQGTETDDAIVNRLQADKFAGFFVSAATLLDFKEGEKLDTKNLLARLAIAYTLESSRSLAHLEDIDPSKVDPRATSILMNTLLSVIEGSALGQAPETIQQLERFLVDLLNQACRSDSAIRLATHPSNAFPTLAEQIRRTSSVWTNAQVLFLLDDVSTRYVVPAKIQEILSALIFQNSSCAFKITSETQTLLLSLKSPGGVEHASHSRDFETFDLGAEVNKRLKLRSGKKFLCDILDQRGKFFSTHPFQSPEIVLGDRSLADIANDIIESGPTSKKRKTVYHGISSLRAICVGDIGSVITIYQNILKRAADAFPATAQIQSDVLQELCSKELYMLDRRNGHIKSIAKSFAKASHELLLQSGKKQEKRGLRQYSSIYVRVTAGDQENQSRLLRELVDAGVFVFQGGAPRTKTKDSDPIHQFKLTFRKIFGLADYIGLAERDRFELSGTELEEWLTTPANGSDILMRNLSVDETDSDDFEDDGAPPKVVRRKSSRRAQQKGTQQELPLVGHGASTDSGAAQPAAEVRLELPIIEAFDPSKTPQECCDLLILALGFEERAAESARRSVALFSPKRVLAIKYEIEGRAKDILGYISDAGAAVTVAESANLVDKLASLDPSNVAIDVTGLTKGAIFSAVRETVKTHSTAIVAYTEAEEYYPLEANLREVLDAQTERDYPALLTSLKNVLTGETGPYTLEPLQSMVSDQTRMRALLAHGSAKHERLIQLVQERDYDLIRVLADSSDTARATVARWAAEVAVGGALAGSEAGSIEDCNIRDPMDVIRQMERFYRSSYLEGGLNFEIGLTGDKLETIAAAAFCAVLPVNRVWYVKPAVFDTSRFSKGTGASRYFRIRR